MSLSSSPTSTRPVGNNTHWHKWRYSYCEIKHTKSWHKSQLCRFISNNQSVNQHALPEQTFSAVITKSYCQLRHLWTCLNTVNGWTLVVEVGWVKWLELSKMTEDKCMIVNQWVRDLMQGQTVSKRREAHCVRNKRFDQTLRLGSPWLGSPWLTPGWRLKPERDDWGVKRQGFHRNAATCLCKQLCWSLLCLRFWCFYVKHYMSAIQIKSDWWLIDSDFSTWGCTVLIRVQCNGEVGSIVG